MLAWNSSYRSTQTTNVFRDTKEYRRNKIVYFYTPKTSQIYKVMTLSRFIIHTPLSEVQVVGGMLFALQFLYSFIMYFEVKSILIKL
jgi:hypothetical protein